VGTVAILTERPAKRHARNDSSVVIWTRSALAGLVVTERADTEMATFRCQSRRTEALIWSGGLVSAS